MHNYNYDSLNIIIFICIKTFAWKWMEKMNLFLNEWILVIHYPNKHNSAGKKMIGKIGRLHLSSNLKCHKRGWRQSPEFGVSDIQWVLKFVLPG